MTTIADVAFDVPLAHSFAYRVPDGWTLAPGQRVVAPLRGASRVGMIVALRDGADARLKALDRVVDAEPVLSPSHLDLVHWIAAQSLSSVGSTCAALLPPPTTKRTPDAAPRRAADAATRTASDVSASPGGRPELLVGAGREKRALERIEAAPGAVLVIAADIETAARWAQRLARLGHAVRLDSGVPDAERVAAWDALRDGAARLAAGARAAAAPARARRPRDAGGAPARLPRGEPAHLVARLRRVRHGRPLRRVRDRLRLYARRRAPRVPALRDLAAAARDLRRVSRTPALPVRLGCGARGARGAPTVSRRAHRARGARRRARRPRRGAAGGGGRRGRGHRHTRGTAPLRAGGARAGGVRGPGSAPTRAGLPRRRARAGVRVGGRRAGGRRRRAADPVAESRALRVRGGDAPGPPRVLPERADVPRGARLSALPPAGRRHRAP